MPFVGAGRFKIYCMSFNLVGKRAWYIIHQIICKNVFLIVPDTVTDKIFLLRPRLLVSGYFVNPQLLYPVNPAYEFATFWIRSPEWKFLNTPRVWALNPDIFSGDVTRSSPVLYRKYSRRCWAQCYRFFTSWTSVSSLITCLQFNLAMITIHFNYARQTVGRHFEASFHVGRTNWTAKLVKWVK